MTIQVLPQNFTICKVSTIPSELLNEQFCFVGKTDRELSLVCETEKVPKGVREIENGWRAFRIAGKLPFSLVGILSELSGILAKVRVGIFSVSTYDTDYILVKEAQFRTAVEALRRNGIGVDSICAK